MWDILQVGQFLFLYFSVLVFLNVTGEVGEVRWCYGLRSWYMLYAPRFFKWGRLSESRISMNLDFSFVTFQWSFLFISFVFQFWVWIILNSTIHKAPAKRSQHANATCRNMSQHCWAQHIACVWTRCCDMLPRVGCCWLKFDQFQTWANNSQHVATRWPNARNMLRPTMLRRVVLACCDRLTEA